jgi:hypothetical protein
VKAALGRSDRAGHGPFVSSIQPKGHVQARVVVGPPAVIQREAEEDLVAARKNFGYFQERSKDFGNRGNEVISKVKDIEDAKLKDKMAGSLRTFVQTVLEQFEGHYQELREQSRLLNKSEPRYAYFSVDKRKDPDLRYKRRDYKTAKEVKAVSSDKGGRVSEVIKDAYSQVSDRAADKKKVLVVITEKENSWPLRKGQRKNRTVEGIKIAFKEKLDKIFKPDEVKPDEIRVQGINLDDDLSYTATARISKKKWKCSLVLEDKNPSETSFLEEEEP